MSTRANAHRAVRRFLAKLPDPEPVPGECRSCCGYGHIRENGEPTVDRRERKCLDCGGTGKGRAETNPHAIMPAVPCSAEIVPGKTCGEEEYAHGLCEPHYRVKMRADRAGRPPRFRPIRKFGDPLVKLEGTAVRVREDTAKLYTAEAERLGVPVAEVVRKILEAHAPGRRGRR